MSGLDVQPLLDAVPGAAAEEGFGPVTVEVPLERWYDAALAARDRLGCGYFDFLTGVDHGDDIELVCHVAVLDPFGHLALRTLVPAGVSVVTLATVWAGAAWHEREVAEMFGLAFVDASGVLLERPGLLLPPGFEGHPLRKDFALQAREETPWPGDE